LDTCGNKTSHLRFSIVECRFRDEEADFLCLARQLYCRVIKLGGFAREAQGWQKAKVFSFFPPLSPQNPR
jgi:hypothetical protein